MVMRSLQPGEPAWVELLTSLLEVRRILAAEAVALAAMRRTEADLAGMRQIAAEQRNRLHDPLAFAEGDLMFQRVLIRAARNVGFELILNSFARFPEELPDVVAQLYDRRDESIAFYDVIIDLVKSGDASTARTTCLMAFATIDEDWLKRHGHTMKAAPAPKAAPHKKKSKKGR
jgi:DNA-binding FadR family transcriptional regulator